MGMGKIVVGFFSTEISKSVWRLGSLDSALVLAFSLNKLGGAVAARIKMEFDLLPKKTHGRG